MFRWWHRVRDGTLSRQDFQRRMRPVERSIRDMLWYGTRSTDAKTRGTCRDILKHELALFTFVREEGVDPRWGPAFRRRAWTQSSRRERRPLRAPSTHRLLQVCCK